MIDVGALRWERPLAPSIVLPHADRLRNLSDPLSYFPVVYDKIVLVNDADCIRAWILLSGVAAWVAERRVPTVIYPAVPDEASLSRD
jgi:hypothetical protein